MTDHPHLTRSLARLGTCPPRCACILGAGSVEGEELLDWDGGLFVGPGVHAQQAWRISRRQKWVVIANEVKQSRISTAGIAPTLGVRPSVPSLRRQLQVVIMTEGHALSEREGKASPLAR